MAMGRYFSAKRGRGRPRKFVAAKAVPKKVKAYVRKAITADKEEKHYDLPLTLGITDVGSFTHLNSIETGDEIDECNGNEFKMTYYEHKGHISNTIAATHRIRMVHFIDMSAVGTTPSEALLFATATLNAPENGCLFNTNNSKRFRILSDKYIHLNPVAEPGSEAIYNIRYKLNTVVQKSGVGNSPVDYVKGTMWMYQTSSAAGAGISDVSASRVTFVEK